MIYALSVMQLINKKSLHDLIYYLFCAFEKSDIGVAIAGPDHSIISNNYAFSNIFGYQKNNILTGKKIKYLFKKKLNDKYDIMLKEFKKKGFWECSTVLIKKKRAAFINLSLTELENITNNTSHILIVVKDCTKFKETEKKLKIAKGNLEIKNIKLVKKNTALKEIIIQVELEKHRIQQNIKENIAKMIMPMIKNLKAICKEEQNKAACIESIEKNLLNINLSVSENYKSDYEKLSPREIEICNMIKKNLSNKEIADLLYISSLTVERHRHNIRKKLGIAKKKMNLCSYLNQK